MPLKSVLPMSKRGFILFIALTYSIFGWSQNWERSLSKEDWKFQKFSDDVWSKAQVPGTIHTDLFLNNLIEDPFYGKNEKQLQWIEDQFWVYQTNFNISKKELTAQNKELVFYGLDTDALVYLNDSLVLEAKNMFRTWRIQVQKLLRLGRNTLRIEFESSTLKAKKTATLSPFVLPGEEKVYVRKAPYQFGWDWGPRYVTSGIWKKVALNFWNSAKLESVSYTQEKLNDKIAQLRIKTTVKCDQPGIYLIKINDKKKSFSLKKGIQIVEIPYQINNPKRWWPNGLGAPNLYGFTVQIKRKGELIDKKKLQIGLRTIELVQEKDSIGKSFYFKINGRKLFMKGANYIPPESFMPKMTYKKYENLIETAVKSNMNMLRVWGGGVYENDVFYDLCDQKGILVWQDFMFACALFPGDEAFISNVKQEVKDQVVRLQNHPCIALWCGNNEVDEGWKNWGWQKQYRYSKSDSTTIWTNYQRLFEKEIPAVLDSIVSKESKRYWPSSPSIGWGKKESLTQGDSHYWGVWWGMEPLENYSKKVGRFMSEYGFQGMPDNKTFESFAKVSELNLNSETVKAHQKHPTGYETIQTYLERDYKVPTSFEDYIYVSQLLQARGFKIAIEAHRSAMPYCMGSLYWQLNDCWPVTSWSSTDYYGRWKAAQYQVKRSFDSKLIIIKGMENSDKRDFNSIKIQIINEELYDEKGVLKVSLLQLDGTEIWKKTKSILLKSNVVTNAMELSNMEIPEVKLWKDCLIHAEFINSKGEKTTANYYFVTPKELNLQKSKISYQFIDNKHLEFSTTTLAKDLFIQGEGIEFDDNYFDLLPNEKRVIRFKGKKGLLKIKCLNDL
jgi:beta-mannosidase